jgi:hypothetical protein
MMLAFLQARHFHKLKRVEQVKDGGLAFGKGNNFFEPKK